MGLQVPWHATWPASHVSALFSSKCRAEPKAGNSWRAEMPTMASWGMACSATAADAVPRIRAEMSCIAKENGPRVRIRLVKSKWFRLNLGLLNNPATREQKGGSLESYIPPEHLCYCMPASGSH